MKNNPPEMEWDAELWSSEVVDNVHDLALLDGTPQRCRHFGNPLGEPLLA